VLQQAPNSAARRDVEDRGDQDAGNARADDEKGHTPSSL